MSRYNRLSEHLKARFGQKVYKVSIDGGFGCPHLDLGGCVYCDSSTLVPKGHRRGASIGVQLGSGIERVRKRYNAERFIAYFQINTSTYAPIEELRKVYHEAASHPEVVALAISTRPDCIGEDVAGLLSEVSESKELWVELGLQSANDSTLERINRGHTSADFEDAVKRLGERSIDVCAHLIVGLPGEGRADIIKSARYVSEQGIWGVKFHQMQVVKGTELEKLYRTGSINTLCLEDYVSLVVDSIERLRPDMVVHRLSGHVPERFLVAPRWGVSRFVIEERVGELLKKRSTRQGASIKHDDKGGAFA